jgi:integrase
MHTVLDAAGLKPVLRANVKTRPYSTFHGLRHSFASHWVIPRLVGRQVGATREVWLAGDNGALLVYQYSAP